MWSDTDSDNDDLQQVPPGSDVCDKDIRRGCSISVEQEECWDQYQFESHKKNIICISHSVVVILLCMLSLCTILTKTSPYYIVLLTRCSLHCPSRA